MKLRHYLANIFVTASLCVLLSVPSVQASAIYRGAVQAISVTILAGGAILFDDASAGATYQIRTATVDSDNDATLCVLSGDTASSSRGAYMCAQGNEASGGGDLSLNSGNSSGSTVQVSANAGTGYIDLNTGGGVNAVRIQDDGDIEMQVTGKGIILRSPDGSDSYCVVDNSDVFTCTGL